MKFKLVNGAVWESLQIFISYFFILLYREQSYYTRTHQPIYRSVTLGHGLMSVEITDIMPPVCISLIFFLIQNPIRQRITQPILCRVVLEIQGF